MLPISPNGNPWKGGLAATAAAAVLFLGVAGALHHHDGHGAGDCPLCLPIYHLGLAAADGVAPVAIPATDLAFCLPALPGGVLLPGNDPARAPPTCS